MPPHRTTLVPWRPSVAALVALLALALLAALPVGCSDSPREPDESQSDSVLVLMFDNSFSPQIVHLPAPGRIRFLNKGRNLHNAVADDGSWASELMMNKGDEDFVDFVAPGVYPYFCTYHGSAGKGMWGTAIVGDVEYDPGVLGVQEPVADATGVVRRVPSDYPTIQSGVDAADPGDLVLVEPGIYREEVVVTTPSLVIRGTDRNRVIIDGEFVRGNGMLILADGVAVENMTSRNGLVNGFFWTGVTGYRGSYLTAHNNGDYGIYAFDSTDGLFEHAYASGSPDSGFYIGQCNPCRAVIRDVIAEHNAVGYSGTNASGQLYIVSSVWRNNMGGILPNTLDSELLPPVREVTVAANLVVDNHNREAAAHPLMYPALGSGIQVSGGLRNIVERNVIVDHDFYGVLIMPMYHQNYWRADDNVVRDNIVQRSGLADLAVASPGTRGNCFSGNRFATASPAGLQLLGSCEQSWPQLGFDLAPSAGAIARMLVASGGEFPRGDFRTRPAPPPQPQMPDPLGAPVRPAFGVFDALDFDVAKAELPAEAAAYLADASRTDFRPGLDSALERFGAYLPLLVWAGWLAWALGAAPRVGPGRVVLLIALPYLGAAISLVRDGEGAQRGRRGLLLLASAAVYPLILLFIAAASAY